MMQEVPVASRRGTGALSSRKQNLQMALGLFRSLEELLSDSARRSHRCLYVAKGPSAVHAQNHLEFGDLATVNSAAMLFSHVDWSFWCDVPPLDEFEPIREHCRNFVVPERLHDGQVNYFTLRWNSVPTRCVSCFPPDRTIVYPYNFIWHWPWRIRAEIAADRVPMCMTAAAGLFILGRHLGYREIWCFGHDGGYGVAPGLPGPKRKRLRRSYRIFRKAVETVAASLNGRLGTIVRFWPDKC